MKTFKFTVPVTLSIDDALDSEHEARKTLRRLLTAIDITISNEAEVLEEGYSVSFGEEVLEA